LGSVKSRKIEIFERYFDWIGRHSPVNPFVTKNARPKDIAHFVSETPSTNLTRLNSTATAGNDSHSCWHFSTIWARLAEFDNPSFRSSAILRVAAQWN
jgi:hypothetical protein